MAILLLPTNIWYLTTYFTVSLLKNNSQYLNYRYGLTVATLLILTNGCMAKEPWLKLWYLTKVKTDNKIPVHIFTTPTLSSNGSQPHKNTGLVQEQHHYHHHNKWRESPGYRRVCVWVARQNSPTSLVSIPSRCHILHKTPCSHIEGETRPWYYARTLETVRLRFGGIILILCKTTNLLYHYSGCQCFDAWLRNS